MKKIIRSIKAKAMVAQAAIISKSGEGFVDTIAKILISVVIGSLLLVGLYDLFNGTVLPDLGEKVFDMLNYAG